MYEGRCLRIVATSTERREKPAPATPDLDVRVSRSVSTSCQQLLFSLLHETFEFKCRGENQLLERVISRGIV
jgi:hypothetical protein